MPPSSSDKTPSAPYRLDLERLTQRLDRVTPARVLGRVHEVTGMVLRASIPGVVIGDLVEVERARSTEPLLAEVVGFRGERVVLMPLGDVRGVGPESTVRATGEQLTIQCGAGLMGRVLDGLGRPMDGGPALDQTAGLEAWPVERAAPAPMTRPAITRPLETGIRVIDGALTLGVGQRAGVFAGSGVGKSTLLGHIARASSADAVVICLVGERGRELRAFIDQSLTQAGLERAVVVCATSDTPSLVRLKAPSVATAIAEHFRDRQGMDVLLMMDSVTRFARALREVGLAAGEPPVRRGYPPSVFTRLPRLIERAGTSPRGSITALYTVLVEGSDLDEPIADELRALLDGHIVLSRKLAERAHWPAVDVLTSLSRVMPQLVDEAHMQASDELRRLLSTYEDNRTLIQLGAYQRGADRTLDDALDLIEDIEHFLQQPSDAQAPFDETVEDLLDLLG